MPHKRLLALLEKNVSSMKPAAPHEYPQAFEARGRICPAEIAQLPSETKLGFFAERNFSRWQVLTPAELRQSTIPLPSITPLSMPIVHCYDNTYLVIAEDGSVRMWDAIDDLDFDQWPSLYAALIDHLE